MTVLELLLAFLTTYGQKVAEAVPETANPLQDLAAELANTGVLPTEDSDKIMTVIESLGGLVQPVADVAVEAVGGIVGEVERAVEAATTTKTE